MMRISCSIAAKAWRGVPGVRALTRRAAKACVDNAAPALHPLAELSVLLCDDARMREINCDWRGIDKPTNVLSFPQTLPGGGAALGDIAVSHETVEREAREEGKTFEDHYTHMIVHGFLHLIGFDHENDADAANMEGRERDILARLAIADPYAYRTPMKTGPGAMRA